MKTWAASLLSRMGFVKRRGNTKVKTTPAKLELFKSQFLEEIASTVKMEEIPPTIVINWDQTGLNIAPVSSWTMEKEGTKEIKLPVWLANNM